jgi:hypothetical protein
LNLAGRTAQSVALTMNVGRNFSNNTCSRSSDIPSRSASADDDCPTAAVPSAIANTNHAHSQNAVFDLTI